MKKFFSNLFIVLPFLTSASGMKVILGAVSGALASIVVLIPQFTGTAGAIQHGAEIGLGIVCVVLVFLGMIHKWVKGELSQALAQAKAAKEERNATTNKGK